MTCCACAVRSFWAWFARATRCGRCSLDALMRFCQLCATRVAVSVLARRHGGATRVLVAGHECNCPVEHVVHEPRARATGAGWRGGRPGGSRGCRRSDTHTFACTGATGLWLIRRWQGVGSGRRDTLATVTCWTRISASNVEGPFRHYSNPSTPIKFFANGDTQNENKMTC